MLRSIVNNSDNEKSRETRKLLSRFKLFGLILHNPGTHPAFHLKLQELFPRLDYLTGNKFLFFSLTNPPREWKEKIKRDYFGIWEAPVLLSPLNAYETFDEGISSYTLAKSLNIDYQNLPCIILTDDFAGNKFSWIKTNEKYLEKQLTEIGYFCNDSAEEKINLLNDGFKTLLKNIDFCSESGIRKTYTKIGNLLSDFLSFFLQKRNSPDESEARLNVRDVLDSFIKLKSKFNERQDYFEDKCLSMLGSLAHAINNPIANDDEITYLKEKLPVFYNRKDVKLAEVDSSFIQLPQHRFEEESIIIQRTLDKISIIFNSFENGFDYSPLAMGYFKIFEKEINLSVVHWVRNLLEIEMPSYFNKVKPNFSTAVIIPKQEFIVNARAVNFNRAHFSAWQPPGLGESELVVNSLIAEGEKIPGLDYFTTELMQNWHMLRQIRNKSAHTELLSYSDYQIAKSTFQQLENNGIFNRLLQLKSRYKGATVL